LSKKEFLSCAEDVVCQIDAVFSSVSKRAEHLVNIFHLVEEDRWFYYLNHVAQFRVDEKTASTIMKE